MKRLFAALAAFALPATIAAWLALIPLGGDFAPFDPLGQRVLEMQGRSAAVFALLMAGIGFAVLAALAVKAGPRAPATARPAQDHRSRARHSSSQDTASPAPGGEPSTPALEEPELAFPAAGPATEEEPPEAPPAPAAPPPLPPPATPIALIRKPRERYRDWFMDQSWLGGLPRLGDRPWPRDTAGTPLPFAAQISLAELAAARADTPLPTTGSLAFFLGEGAVVPVPEGVHDFSAPPDGLPPAYEEGGSPFPLRASRLTRWFFPFWPVTPAALDLPDPADEDAFVQQLRRYAPLRDHPFYAAGVGAPLETLWWHSVIHLADRLQDARDESPALLARRRDEMARQHAELARLRIDSAAVPYALEDAQEIAEQLDADFALLQEQCAALPAMVDALDQFVAGRDPMTQLTPDELTIVGDILAEVHERYGAAVQDRVPGTLAQLATISLRAMMVGPPEMLAALPDPILRRINREYRLPPVHQHRMLDIDGGDTLLLQLGYDDLVEWSWPENGVWRFRIDPVSLAAQDWSAARVTFEELP